MFLAQLNKIKNRPCKYKGEVPDIINFIYIKGYEFQLHHFLAVKKAQSIMNFDKIYIYNDHEPEDNIWWNLAKELPSVEIIKVTLPNAINNHLIPFKQHVADLMRLEILNAIGGVYFDLDMIVIKDFTHLLLNVNKETQIMLARENDSRVSNAMIVTLPNTPFIKSWLESYYTQYGNSNIDGWGGLSVEKPNELNQLFPKSIILDTPSFLPFDYFHTQFFTDPIIRFDISQSFAIHLWDTEQQKRGILPKTLEDFLQKKSAFTIMFRKDIDEYYTKIKLFYLNKRVEKIEKSLKTT
jgi:hypothetical protein